MKKLISLSLFGLLFYLNLSANQELALGKLKKIPLDNKFLSNENGGDKSAIDAYSDGIGIYTVGLEDQKFSAMNELVFKYGEEAKKSGETLKEHVLEKGNNKEQELATLLGTTVSGTAIGTSCDDGNPNTENDVYIDTNGSCQGTEIVVSNSVKCEEEAIGSSIIVDGISYLVVDNDSIKNNLDRAETLCTSNVTNMAYMLFHNTSFNGDISHWDTSNVTNMESMFLSSQFNGDISNWDVSKVTDMNYMFQYADFNGDINDWNISNVTDMSWMLGWKFNQPLNKWNVSNVKYMRGMFTNSSYYPNHIFEQNINMWNISNVIDVNFNNCLEDYSSCLKFTEIGDFAEEYFEEEVSY
jgi:surface protein